MSYDSSPSLSDLLHPVWPWVHPWCCKWHYFILYNGWIILHWAYVLHLLSPFLCRWTYRLLPCLGLCKQCCNEHWHACMLLNHIFLWIYAQSGDCRVMLFSYSIVVSDSLWTHGLNCVRLPCPSLSSGICSSSCPLNWWCYPTISLSWTIIW